MTRLSPRMRSMLAGEVAVAALAMRRPEGERKKLLTHPHDPMNEGDVRHRKAAVRKGRVEAAQLDMLGGETAQLLGHDFAGAGLGDDTVPAPQIPRRRDQDA